MTSHPAVFWASAVLGTAGLFSLCAALAAWRRGTVPGCAVVFLGSGLLLGLYAVYGWGWLAWEAVR